MRNTPEPLPYGPQFSSAPRFARIGAGRAGSKHELSIALLFCFSMFGFYSFGPIIQLITEGSELSIAFRGVVVALAIYALIKARFFSGGATLLLFFFYLFMALYTARMVDNFYVEQLDIYIDPLTAFSFLVGAGFLPALAISRVNADLRDPLVARVMMAMFLTFCVGLYLNADALLKTSVHRIMLEKVNAIAMSALAGSYLMFFLLYARVSRLMLCVSIVAVVVSAVVIAFSGSRGPAVAMVGSYALYFLMSPNRHRKTVLKGSAIVATLALIASFAFDLSFSSNLVDRFDLNNPANALSVDGRLLAWSQAWSQFLADPLIGRYIFEKANFHYPHNLLLEAMMSTGVIGGFAFVMHNVIALYSSKKILWSRNNKLVEIFVVMLYFKESIQSMFSGALWSSSSYWVASCCVIGIFVQKRRMRRAFAPPPPYAEDLAGGAHRG